jgi:hypothetical protein
MVGIDDFVEGALVVSAISAFTSLAAGVVAQLKTARPANKTGSGDIEVKMPNGTVVRLSKSMGQAEWAANIQTIQSGLASVGGGRTTPLLAEQPANAPLRPNAALPLQS